MEDLLSRSVLYGWKQNLKSGDLNIEDHLLGHGKKTKSSLCGSIFQSINIE